MEPDRAKIPVNATSSNKSVRLCILLVLITALTLVAGIWPFEFHPANKVAWIKDINGIRFFGQGIVRFLQPEEFQEKFRTGGPISLELFIRPDRQKTKYVAQILSFLDGQGVETFMVAQWNSHLILKTRLKGQDGQERYYEWGLDDVLEKNVPRTIAITSGAKGTELYLDGIRKSSYFNDLILPQNGRSPQELIIGTSPTGEYYWTGAVLGLAIYNRQLDSKEVFIHNRSWKNDVVPFFPEEQKPLALYLFSERGGNIIRNHENNHNHLLLPPTFKPVKRTILGMPRKNRWLSRGNLLDILVNVIGLIPFGFIITAWLRSSTVKVPLWHIYTVALVCGLCISLTIELTQSYLPARDSSRLDVVSNTCGTALGILLYRHYVTMKKFFREKIPSTHFQ